MKVFISVHIWFYNKLIMTATLKLCTIIGDMQLYSLDLHNPEFQMMLVPWYQISAFGQDIWKSIIKIDTARLCFVIGKNQVFSLHGKKPGAQLLQLFKIMQCKYPEVLISVASVVLIPGAPAQLQREIKAVLKFNKALNSACKYVNQNWPINVNYVPVVQLFIDQGQLIPRTWYLGGKLQK